MIEFTRYVHTVWCDEIRQELGNKFSFMGVFSGGLLIPQLPSQLHRLGVHTWIISPIERPITSLKLQIVRDDGTIVIEIVQDAPADQTLAHAQDITRCQVVTGINIGNIELPVDCKWLMVRVFADNEVLEGPKLRIYVSGEPFTTETGSTQIAQQLGGLPTSTSSSET